MPCLGVGDQHCCRIKGQDCPHLIHDYTDEDGHFRNFACGLRAELGSWDAVLEDPRYPADSWAPGVNCRDWPEGPPKWRGCNLCGACND